MTMQTAKMDLKRQTGGDPPSPLNWEYTNPDVDTLFKADLDALPFFD